MKFLIICFTVCFIYLFGCGNDSTTNNGNSGNGETVIFSMDSLSIYLNSTIESKDTNINILNSQNVKLSFECETNSDSIHSTALFRISAIDSSMIYLDSTNDQVSKLNNFHSVSILASNSFNLIILIQIQRNNSNPYFIKLKNIKLIKL